MGIARFLDLSLVDLSLSSRLGMMTYESKPRTSRRLKKKFV